jgi:hypothetical protein
MTEHEPPVTELELLAGALYGGTFSRPGLTIGCIY